MSRISKKTSYRIWGWSSFFIFVASIVLFFELEDIPYSLIIVAVVYLVSLFVWLLCWAEKDWTETETKVYSGYKSHKVYNTGLLKNKKSIDSSESLKTYDSNSKEEISALENLAGLYIIDQIFGGGLFGKK